MRSSGRGVGRDVVPAERADPELRVADERPDVDADRAVVAGEVVGDGPPVVVDVGPAVEARVELDEGEQVLVPLERREAVAVDPDDLGRDALADLGLVPRLGEDHQAAVAVQVDEAGRDDAARGIDLPADVLGERRVHGEQRASGRPRRGPCRAAAARPCRPRWCRPRSRGRRCHSRPVRAPAVHASDHIRRRGSRPDVVGLVFLTQSRVRPPHPSDVSKGLVGRSGRVVAPLRRPRDRWQPADGQNGRETHLAAHVMNVAQRNTSADPPGCSPAARAARASRGGTGNSSPTAAPAAVIALRLLRVPATTNRMWSCPASRHLSMTRRVWAWKSWILVSASAGSVRCGRHDEALDHPIPSPLITLDGQRHFRRQRQVGMQPRPKAVEQRQLTPASRNGAGPG